MNKLAEYAAALPWAIRPTMLATILAIANGEGPGPEAVSRELGRPLDNTRAVTLRGSVAVVPVTGPIFRRANMLTEISGATSVEILARDINTALADPNVRAVVLDVDSPGGEVTGIHELADMLYAARGGKPIVAYAGGSCASAAYWLASACEQLVVDATAQVGSIGVVASVPNPAADSAGKLEFVSSQSPGKHPDLRTDEGRAILQSKVDTLAGIFVDDVARNRHCAAAKVLSDFGRGGELFGAAAVAAGMADALGSLEGVIASLNAGELPAKPKPAADAAEETRTMSDPKAPRVTADAQPPANPAPAPPAPAAADGAPMMCPDCGAENAPDAKFCDQCGAAIAAAEPAPGPASAPSPGSARALLALVGVATMAAALPIVAGALERAKQYDALTGDLAKMRAEKREGEVEQILTDGARAGKRAIVRDRMKLLQVAGANAEGKGADPERLRLLVEALPVEMEIGASSKTPAPASTRVGSVELTADEVALCHRRGWKIEDFAAEKARITGRASVPNGG